MIAADARKRLRFETLVAPTASKELFGELVRRYARRIEAARAKSNCQITFFSRHISLQGLRLLHSSASSVPNCRVEIQNAIFP